MTKGFINTPIKIKHPGELHRELGVPVGHKIPAAKLHAAEKRPGKVGVNARYAVNVLGAGKR